MKYFVIFFIVLSTTFGISTFDYAEARGFTPFSFSLADEITYNDLSFYVDGSKSNLIVEKGETVTYPLIIGSRAGESTTVDFHATIGNDQMGEIRFPLGVDIHLKPSQIILNGTEQILNVTIHTSEKAPSNKYNINLVGVWEEEGKIPEFMGTSFSLHVGKDFGNDAVPINFFMSPLKSVQHGMPAEEIVCRNGMIMILKHNDTPVCIYEETKPKLIQRGWMKTQVNVFDDLQFIDSTKSLDEVKQFLALHPNAQVRVDPEMFTVHYEESGFREHRASSMTQHTKGIGIGLDYQGRPYVQELSCGSSVSMSTTNISLLDDPDWCFPLDQSHFLDKYDFETEFIAESSDDFTFAFYSKVVEQDKDANAFFSPLSISTAFSIAYEGATENTASQIQQVFGFEEDDSKRHQKISEVLSRLNHEDDWYNLQVANALWIKDEYQIKQDYIDTAKTHYSSTIENVDFVTNEGIDRINDWTRQKTNDRIQQILEPDSTDDLTLMVITNAVYFKGKWGLEFNADNTHEQPFWTDMNNSVQVPMMKEAAAVYNYAETDDLQALELNYLGGDVSMIILLPKEKDGLMTLEQSLDKKKFDSIKDKMTNHPLTVKIPKFEFETKYNLINSMKDLGIRDAFDENNADFQGITDERIYLDKAVHKAFVNVNEEGTEAAAITALVGRFSSGPPEPVAEFVADHPFMFVIQEKESGNILFIGRLVSP